MRWRRGRSDATDVASLNAAVFAEVRSGELRWLVEELGFVADRPGTFFNRFASPEAELELFFYNEVGHAPELSCRIGDHVVPAIVTISQYAEAVARRTETDRFAVEAPEDVTVACRGVSDLLRRYRRVLEHPSEAVAEISRPSDDVVETELDRRLDATVKVRLLTAIQDTLADAAPWLAADAGMRQVSARWPVVRLTSDSVGLSVYVFGSRHGAPPAAIAIAVEWLPTGEVFGPEPLSVALGRPNLDEPVLAEGPESVMAGLSDRLEALRPLLSGDLASWQALRRRLSETVATTQRAEDLRDDVPRGRDAFDRGDFGAVIRLLGPLEDELRGDDRKRLEIARRRV